MDFERSYDIDFNDIIKKPYGYMMVLDKDSLMLKAINLKENRIVSCAMVCDYIYNKGFLSTVRILKSKKGKYYIKDGKDLYVLFDRVYEKKLRLNSKENAVDAARILAQFHNFSEGYVPPLGVKLDVLWGKKIEKYKKFTCCIEKFYDMLFSTHNLDEFCSVSEEFVNEFLLRAKSITKFLRSEEYILYLEDSMKRKEICINSISANTFKIYDGDIVIDDIFHIGYNMVEEDIALLVKKAIEQTNDREIFADIINEYRKWRNIDDFSLCIVKALVSYPYNSIKVIEKYMKYPGRGVEFVTKFQKYSKQDKITDILGV